MERSDGAGWFTPKIRAGLRQNQLFCLKPHGPRTRAGLPDAWLPISTADQDGLGSRLDHLFWCHSISSSARSRRELEQGVPGRACDLTLQEVASGSFALGTGIVVR